MSPGGSRIKVCFQNFLGVPDIFQLSPLISCIYSLTLKSDFMNWEGDLYSLYQGFGGGGVWWERLAKGDGR